MIRLYDAEYAAVLQLYASLIVVVMVRRIIEERRRLGL